MIYAAKDQKWGWGSVHSIAIRNSDGRTDVMSCAGVSDDFEGDDARINEANDGEDTSSADEEDVDDDDDGGEKDDGRCTEGSSERTPVAATGVVGDSNETRFLSGGGEGAVEAAAAMLGLELVWADVSAALSFRSDCCNCVSVREITNDSPLKFAAFKLADRASVEFTSDSKCAAASE
jgi:hypothetical protein